MFRLLPCGEPSARTRGDLVERRSSCRRPLARALAYPAARTHCCGATRFADTRQRQGVGVGSCTRLAGSGRRLLERVQDDRREEDLEVPLGSEIVGPHGVVLHLQPHRTGIRPNLNMPIVPRPMGNETALSVSAFQLIRMLGVIPISQVSLSRQLRKYWMSI